MARCCAGGGFGTPGAVTRARAAAQRRAGYVAGSGHAHRAMGPRISTREYSQRASKMSRTTRCRT
jgi:hypothetical protein